MVGTGRHPKRVIGLGHAYQESRRVDADLGGEPDETSRLMTVGLSRHASIALFIIRVSRTKLIAHL